MMFGHKLQIVRWVVHADMSSCAEALIYLPLQRPLHSLMIYAGDTAPYKTLLYELCRVIPTTLPEFCF